MDTIEPQTVLAPASDSPPAHRARTLVADIGALGALQALQRVPGLILLPIISKGLGVSAYGLWTLFFVAGEMIGIMCDVALDDALVRVVPGLSNRRDQQEYFYSLVLTVAGLSILPCLIFVLFPQTFAIWLFGGVQNTSWVLLLAIYLVMEAFDNMALSMLRGLLQMKLFVYLEASQIVVRTVLVIATLWAGSGLSAALSVYMATQFVWLLVEFGIIYRLIGFRWPAFTYIRSCLAYSLPLVPTRYSATILTYSDRLIIARVMGPAAVGVYSASYDLALLLWHMVNPIRVALYPAVCRLWDEGRHREAGQYLTLSMKYALLLAVPAIVGLVVLAPPLLRLLATDEFARASILIIPFASIGVLLSGMAMFFNLMLRLHKNTRIIALSFVVAAILHLALNLILIPAIGFMGGAIATLAGYSLSALLSGLFVWRRSPFDLPFRPFAISIAAALVMLPVVMWVGRGNNWASVLGAAAIGAGVYMTMLFALGGITKEEILFIWLERRK